MLRQILKIKLLNTDAKLPSYAHNTDAGMDLYLTEEIKLKPYERKKIKLGIAIELPKNTVGRILEKSSRGNEGLKLFGGVIDEGYRGELMLVIWNTNKNSLSYKQGTAIAQLAIYPVIHPIIKEVCNLSETERGTGGFGSTDRNI